MASASSSLRIVPYEQEKRWDNSVMVMPALNKRTIFSRRCGPYGTESRILPSHN